MQPGPTAKDMIEMAALVIGCISPLLMLAVTWGTTRANIQQLTKSIAELTKWMHHEQAKREAIDRRVLKIESKLNMLSPSNV